MRNNQQNEKGNQMSNEITVTYCELHNIASYHKPDGSVQHTCGQCHPEVLPAKVDHHKRITNYGARIAKTGEFCDRETLDMILTNCKFYVEYPDNLPDAENAFYDDYQENTGDAIYSGKRVHPIDCSKSQKRWYSVCIAFDYSEDMNINPGFKIHGVGSRRTIYSNHFAGYLFANGARITDN
jgi:hypothetical protein